MKSPVAWMIMAVAGVALGIFLISLRNGGPHWWDWCLLALFPVLTLIAVRVEKHDRDTYV